MDNSTRNSRSPKRNDKGQLPVKVGGRSGYQVFKFSRSVSDKEAEGRTVRLKEIYQFWSGMRVRVTNTGNTPLKSVMLHVTGAS